MSEKPTRRTLLKSLGGVAAGSALAYSATSPSLGLPKTIKSDHASGTELKLTRQGTSLIRHGSQLSVDEPLQFDVESTVAVSDGKDLYVGDAAKPVPIDGAMINPAVEGDTIRALTEDGPVQLSNVEGWLDGGALSIDRIPQGPVGGPLFDKEPIFWFPDRNAEVRIGVFQPTAVEGRDHPDTPNRDIPVGNIKAYVNSREWMNLHFGVWRERYGRETEYVLWMWESKVLERSITIREETIEELIESAKRKGRQWIDDVARRVPKKKLSRLLVYLARFVGTLIAMILAAAASFFAS